MKESSAALGIEKVAVEEESKEQKEEEPEKEAFGSVLVVHEEEEAVEESGLWKEHGVCGVFSSFCCEGTDILALVRSISSGTLHQVK